MAKRKTMNNNILHLPIAWIMSFPIPREQAQQHQNTTNMWRNTDLDDTPSLQEAACATINKYMHHAFHSILRKPGENLAKHYSVEAVDCGTMCRRLAIHTGASGAPIRTHNNKYTHYKNRSQSR